MKRGIWTSLSMWSLVARLGESGPERGMEGKVEEGDKFTEATTEDHR
jgi:hypothetical protein